MRMIRIEESKKDKMEEHAEKAIKHLGKLMQCIEDLGDDGYGERDDDWEDDDEYEGMRYGGGSGGYGNRGGYGGMRRSRRTGRYIR